MTKILKVRVFYISATLLMSGCSSLGPRTVERVHYEYNTAIAKTADEQLLLNIVRLKYRDNPYFLEPTQIAENRKFTTRFGISGTKFGLASNAGKHELGILGYNEIFQNPTITYLPLQGEKFTHRMVSPIPLAVVLGLMQAGWSTKRVFNLCLECINHLDNASSASGPTPTRKPNYESFTEAIDILDTLYSQKHLVIGLSSGNSKELILKFTNSDSQSQQLKSLLGLDKGRSEFHFNSNFLDASDTNLSVRTRSMMEVLFYLSHAVCVPEKDIEAGLVTETEDETGEIFDWSENLSGEWIAINYSEGKDRPVGAFVSVFYRGKWFYITDNNLNAKSTFMFLTYLFNLQSGDSMAAVPMLTLSAN
ncbi:MAG: hypothetical protein LBS71_02310 [Puniceicoccales bacterium]|jgi:hypothetical protein|nr:hypothetical protein [Puniceicoccales bacterium]